MDENTNKTATAKTDETLAKHDEFIRSIPERYGAEAQFSMAIEEMAELIQALEKHRRSKDDPVKLAGAKEHVAEEIADVRIMLAQLTSIFDNDADVSRYVEYKLKRQRDRVANEEKSQSK